MVSRNSSLQNTYSYDPTEPKTDSQAISNDADPDWDAYERHMSRKSNSSREGYDEDEVSSKPWNYTVGQNRWVDEDEDDKWFKDAEDEEQDPVELDAEEPVEDDLIILQPPQRELDPGAFVVQIVVGRVQILNGLIDTGASRNVMPKSTYDQINKYRPPPLFPCHCTLWFGDQIQAEPLGILNTTVTIEGYPIPTEFLVINTNNERRAKTVLGRPFLATAKAQIDFDRQDLTLNLPNVCLRFNVTGGLYQKDPHNLQTRQEIAGTRSRANDGSSLGGWGQ